MRRLYLGGLALALALRAAPAEATLVISVDMDPATAGVQSSLTVSPGDSFAVDVVVTGDGSSTFVITLFDVAFNDSGAVLGLGAGPIAGSLAGTFPSVVDAFGLFPVGPGDPLATGGAPPPPGFGDSIGGVGLGTVGGPFPTIAAGTDVDIVSLAFQATAPGTSTLDIVGFPLGSPLFALEGLAVAASVAPGTVTVQGVKVPEPASLALFAIGLAGLGFIARRRKLVQ